MLNYQRSQRCLERETWSFIVAWAHFSDTTRALWHVKWAGTSLSFLKFCSAVDQRKHQKLQVTGPMSWESTGNQRISPAKVSNAEITGEFHSQTASKAENVSLSWRQYLQKNVKQDFADRTWFLKIGPCKLAILLIIEFVAGPMFSINKLFLNIWELHIILIFTVDIDKNAYYIFRCEAFWNHFFQQIQFSVLIKAKDCPAIYNSYVWNSLLIGLSWRIHDMCIHFALLTFLLGRGIRRLEMDSQHKVQNLYLYSFIFLRASILYTCPSIISDLFWKFHQNPLKCFQ